MAHLTYILIVAFVAVGALASPVQQQTADPEHKQQASTAPGPPKNIPKLAKPQEKAGDKDPSQKGPQETPKDDHKEPSKAQPSLKGPQVTPNDDKKQGPNALPSNKEPQATPQDGKKGAASQPSGKGPQENPKDDKLDQHAQPSLKVVPKANVPQKTQAQAVQATEKLQKVVKTSAPPLVARKAPSQTVAGIKTGAAAVSSMGANLQPAFAKQWQNLLDFTHKDYQDFAKKVQTSVNGPAATAVTALIAKLNAVVDQQKTKVNHWIDQQGKDVNGLVTKYADLIKTRLESSGGQNKAAADESAINALRNDDQTIVLKWQADLLDLINATRLGFLNIIKQAAAAAKDPSSKKAIQESGKRLLWRLIDEQVRTLTLLTATQIPQFAAFVVQGAKVLFQIAVAAQADSL